MIQLSMMEPPADPTPCGLAPYLIETLTHSLCAQFRADFTWASLRLPGEPGVVLASAGRLPASFPLAPVRWEGGAMRLESESPDALVAVGSLRYEGATFDYLIGRAERGLSPLEWTRFEGLIERWQAALDEANLEQRTQALAFQARLAQRREAQCRTLRARLEAQEERQRVVYHDLVNDMTPAVFAVEILQERIQGFEDLHHLVLLDRQFDRMRRRLRREIASTMAGPASGCDLGRVVRECLESWRGAFERQGHRLTTRLPDSPLWVEGEEDALSAIAYNLLSNAQKYTPAGGAIEISLSAQGRQAHLVVKDSGPGIAPDVKARLFEPGIRERSEIEGSGVGLAQAARIVRSLLGGISVVSAPGEGSAFRVQLPLSKEER